MRAAPPTFMAIALVLVALSHVCAQPAALEDPALAAARARQEAVKTVAIEFKQTEVIARGGLSELESPLARQRLPVPADETTLESINRLVIDGEKFRYEDNHPSRGGSKWISRKPVSVFDGSVWKSLYPTGMNGNGKPVGIIDKDDPPRSPKSPVLIPVSLAFRGLNPAFTEYPLTKMQPTESTLLIDGAPCHKYTFRNPDNTIVGFWLDPDKDHILRRKVDQRRNGTVAQLDISYRRDDTFGWVPDSWIHTVSSSTGAVLKTIRVDILAMQLNDAQPAEQFDIRFPAGASVIDHTNKKEYWVQPNGSMREVFPSGEELPSPKAEPKVLWYHQILWLWPLWLLLVSVGVVAATVYALQRKRAKTA